MAPLGGASIEHLLAQSKSAVAGSLHASSARLEAMHMYNRAVYRIGTSMKGASAGTSRVA